MEFIVEAPGKCTLNIEKTFKEPIADGLDPLDPAVDLTKYKIKLKYDCDEEATYYGNLTANTMAEAQTIIFNGEMQGKADWCAGPYWIH
jgi:hypothetical protein